jgi:UDP-2-acetamido-2-deoxy-ribo-hexuluronate aminotransferase
MEFCDLKAQYRAYKPEIDAAIQGVLDSAAFVGGAEVKALEGELARFAGVPHAVTCANGTDALFAAVKALGAGPGDEVIVPDFTFFATAEAVALAGATPVFADIDPLTYDVTPETVATRITSRTRGLIPVSLFGHMPDLDGLARLAQAKGLWIVEDAAQSFGAGFRGRRSGSFTEIAATSFFPAKPLGCYGDGGALFVRDGAMADRLRAWLNHGSSQRYHHVAVGVNSRLDGMQAAVLRVKLRHFASELENRARAAAWYGERLRGRVSVPVARAGHAPAWAQYTLRVPERDRVQAALQARGIPTAIHYPLPLHAQPAFASLGVGDEACPQAARAAREVLSLPMHGLMTEAEVDTVCRALLEVLP